MPVWRFLIATCLLAAGEVLQAQPQIIGPSEVCQGCHDFSIEPLSGTVYQWQVNGPAGYTQTFSSNPLTICFDSLANGVYTVMAVTANGVQVTKTVYFWPANPIALFSSGNAFCEEPGGGCPQVCAGTEISYGMEYPGQYKVNIEVIGGILLEEDQYRFTVLWDQPGQGQIHLTSDHPCLLPASVCVDVLPVPDAAIGWDGLPAPDTLTVCTGMEVLLQDFSQPAALAFWTISDGRTSLSRDPRFRFDLPGDFVVTLIESGGCTCGDTARLIIRVDPLPAPALECAGTVCPGEEVTYHTTPGCAWAWTVSGEGTVLAGGTPGSDSVTVLWQSGPEGVITLAAPGCAGVCAQEAVIRIPVLDGSAVIQGPAPVCTGSEATYFMVPYHGTDYTWTVSPGATILSGQGSHQIRVAWSGSSAITSGWVEVQYAHCSEGCTGSAHLDVPISRPFHVRGPLAGCPGDTMVFEALTGPLPLACSWEVLDSLGQTVLSVPGPTSVFPYAAIHGSGRYTVVATQSDPLLSCNLTYRWPFRVNPPPAPPDSITGPMLICPGGSYVYAGHSSLPAHSLEWTLQNGGMTEKKVQDQTIVTWAASGGPWRLELRHRQMSAPHCVSGPLFMDVQAVGPFVLQGTPEVCPGATESYTPIPPLPGLDLQWSVSPSAAGIVSGNGGSPGVIHWAVPGPAQVAASVCGQNATLNVQVRNPPAAGITGPAGVCTGSSALLQAQTGMAEYGWHDAMGNFVSDQSSVLLSPSTWILGIEDAFGCRDTVSYTLEAWPTPEVSLSSPDPHGYCPAQGETGPTLYTLGAPGGFQIEWYRDMMLIPLANGPTLSGATTGNYHVVVTDPNGCTSVSNTLSVFEHCTGGGGVVIGSGMVNGSPCPELNHAIAPGPYCNERQYQASSSTGSLLSPEWRIHDFTMPGPVPLPDDTADYVFTQAGYYTIYFQGIIGGTLCELAFIDTIPVSADFVSADVCDGQSMDFGDKSSWLIPHAITAWEWDFGDPASGASNTSNLPSPSHVFSGPGNYSVTLIVTSSLGCRSRRIRTVFVRPGPALMLSGPDQACLGSPVSWTGTSDRTITQWSWDFDDPPSGGANQSSLQNPVHAFAGTGAKNISLSATDAFGCHSTVTHLVQVQANTLTGILQFASPICEGDTSILHFTGSASILQWAHGASGNDIPVQEPGVYVLSAGDANGCTYQPPPALVDVVPEPGGLIRALLKNDYGVIAGIHYNHLTTCYGDPVVLGLELSGHYDVVWSTGQSDKQLEFSPNRGNALFPGMHTFTATITDPLTGCTTVIGPMVIDVRPLPAKPTITFQGPPPHCAFNGEMLQVVSPVAGITYQWSSGQTGNPIEAIGPGEYSVRAVDVYGCQAESDPLTVLETPSILLAPDGCHKACKPDTLCIGQPAWLQSWQWHLDGQPIPAPEGQMDSIQTLVSGRYHLVLTHQNGCTAITESSWYDLVDGDSDFTGRVWMDVNDNGIIDGPDTLMDGVNVVLQGPAGQTLTSTTQSGGQYLFNGVSGLGDFMVSLDESAWPAGWQIVWGDSLIAVAGCNEEHAADFLIRFQCLAVYDSIGFAVCPGAFVIVENDSLYGGMNRQIMLSTAQGCDSIVTVTVTDLPGFSFTVTTDTGCIGQPDGSLTVQPSGSPSPLLEGSLDGIAWRSPPVWDQLEPGHYNLQVRDGYGCVQTAMAVVPAWPAMEFSLPPAVLDCEGAGVTLGPVWSSGRETAISMTWSDGSTDSVFIADRTGPVTLTIQGLCGTVSRTSVVDYGTPTPRPDRFFYVPNVFSPDFNGINDQFRPLPAAGITVASYRFEVFDRWGNLMFTTRDPDLGWDGVRRDRETGQQVFVWWLEATVRHCRDTFEIKRKGDVTLMVDE